MSERAARVMPWVIVAVAGMLMVRHDTRVRSVVCGTLLAASIAGGVLGWRAGAWWRPTWPRWPDEVQAWERDPRTPLHIWPLGWTMRLAPRRSPGTATPADGR